MQDDNTTGFTAFIDSLGGADMFIWIVMFGTLTIFVLVMAYINRDAPRDQ